jgi:hypothetical protein
MRTVWVCSWWGYHIYNSIYPKTGSITIYNVLLFIFLFISLPYKYIIIFDGNKDLLYSWIHLPFATALTGGSASRVDGAYLFRVESSFRDSGITSFSLDVRPVFFFPSNFCTSSIYFIVIIRHARKLRSFVGSRTRVLSFRVRSFSTVLAGPG